MQINQIEAFVEVARQGSISRAAEALYLTQPTVTERLKSLEEVVNERLFTRVRYGVALTEAGKTLLPYAERILNNIAEARAAIENLQHATQGDLSLGASSFISLYLLPTILERFGAEYPGVRVLVRTGHSEDVLDMVRREEVQIGLIIKLRHRDIEAVKLYEDEFILVAPPSHPFSHVPSVTMEEVAREGVVSFDRTTNYYKLVNAIFVNAGLAPKVRFEMDSVEGAKKMVEKGLGVSLLPRMAVQREIASGALKAVRISDSPPLKRELVAIYRKSSGLGGIARAFLDVAEATVPTPDSGRVSPV